MNKEDLEGWFLMELNMEEVVGKDIPPQNEEEEMEMIDPNLPKHLKDFYEERIREKWRRIKSGDKTTTKETPIWEIEIED